jgi:hypothetical protein
VPLPTAIGRRLTHVKFLLRFAVEKSANLVCCAPTQLPPLLLITTPTLVVVAVYVMAVGRRESTSPASSATSRCACPSTTPHGFCGFDNDAHKPFLPVCACFSHW